ncbi:hypothetical protein [Pyxidicoccus sp. MSG2]|uniref:hypothetical protein n=1 Tax=Pyxidicoccus sp. MSG2 TaxID=2996790 RepID=UPI0022717F16|nr:hypothetical protein [Pyxidicoccus sp. MSG2]MCY1019661.1 hypothetical protein [Pyxidicoccus sp. MSG2]
MFQLECRTKRHFVRPSLAIVDTSMSWANFQYPAVRQPDRKVLSSLLSVLTETGITPTSASVTVLAGPSVSVSGAAAKTCETIRDVLPVEGGALRSLTVNGAFQSRTLSVVVHRDPQQVLDQVGVNLADLGPLGTGREHIVAMSNFIARLQADFPPIDTRGGLKSFMGDETLRVLERREAELQRVEQLGYSLTEQLTQAIAETRLRLVEEFDGRRAQLDADHKVESERLRAQAAERERALEEREKAHKARLAEIDDRDSRHVRREIRKEQKEELQASAQEFKLTAGTNDLRKPIAHASLGLMAFFLLAAVASTAANIYLLVTGAQFSVAMWIALGAKQAALTAGLVSTAVFYIRWSNRWLEQHSSEEFRLKRLGLDLDRASWLVETAMEWKEEKGSEIPNILVERLSAGLFTPDVQKEAAPLHPADQLASALLGASAEASLELPSGSKLRLDRKGLRALQKE